MRIQHSKSLPKSLLVSAVAGTILGGSFLNAAWADEVSIRTFSFETLASRNASFDRSAYTYPSGALEGQINHFTGDVRLDGVVIGGVVYDQSRLQLVTGAKIVLDDAVDTNRGGGNLTTGYGIGADVDTWAGQGIGSTTPTEDNLRAAHANFNLSSIVAVRENVGTAIYELSFYDPTDTLLIWERGNSGDVLVEALDDAGNVVGSILLLDGANDNDAPNDFTRTGIFVTTYVQEGFLNQGQELASVGLRLSEPVSRFRFTAHQEEPGEGAVRYNGPDLKVLALASQTRR